MIRAAHLHRLWRALPFGSLDAVIGDKNCLILAPHPDDESLGCGGLIAACCALGRAPVVSILTDGSGSHPNSALYPPENLIALREAEATRAVQILGLPLQRLRFLREPDTRAPHDGPAFDAVVAQLADCARHFDCSTILAPWQHDPHCDHEAAARIARQAAHEAGIRHVAYPVWGWMLTADVPVDEADVRGWRFDIAAQQPAKQHAIAAHRSQYGRLIADDADAFQLPEGLLRAFEVPWETFVVP